MSAIGITPSASTPAPIPEDDRTTKKTKVNVKEKKIKEIILDQSFVTMDRKVKKYLVATIILSEPNKPELTWSSTNSGAAEVISYSYSTEKANLIMTATAIIESDRYDCSWGTAEITCEVKDKAKSKPCCVTVTPIFGISELKISPKPVTIYEKQTINLTAKITPGNAFNQSMNWKSSDDTIAKVETVNGSNMLTAKLTGKKANTKKVIISCESVHYEFAKDSFLVEVVEGPGELKISLDGLKLLAEMEVNSNSKYMVKEQGELKGIITHDVGDGGLTVGYGFYIKGGMSNTSEINRLKNEYGIIVQEGIMVDIDKVLKLYYESIITYEDRAKGYVNERGISPNQHEFDALVIQAYNGTYYDVMDAFGDKNLNDAQALEKALQKYRTFSTWNDFGDGWTNRLRNIINLYRHGDYTKLY